LAAGDRKRWDTIGPDRTVLAAVRTWTSAYRVLDGLAVFRGDFRVRTLFTVDESSAFSPGAGAYLRRAGTKVVPWDDVAEEQIDLVLTASENIDLERIDAPVVVLPHGIGFHRQVPDSAGSGTRLSGLVPESRLVARKDLWMLVSHPAQRDQLAMKYPVAAGRCLVAGDLTYDRLTVSQALRDDYRQRLGVAAGQRLVVLTSTWDEGSLFAQWRDLAATLLGDQPHDEYRVVLILHPNVWSWYGEYQIERLWLDDARDAGLLFLPPEDGWQAALIAADLVVGDQGSVTLYAAALDKPVLLGASGVSVVPRTPPDDLARSVTRLSPGLPLLEQVEMAIARHRPGQYAFLADQLFSNRGESARVLQRLCYEQLGLALPGSAVPPRAYPEPGPRVTAPTSFWTYSAAITAGELVMRRFPAAVHDRDTSGPGEMRHLCADHADPDRRLPGRASVVVRGRVASAGDASAWAESAFRLYPGARITAGATPDGCRARTWDGRRFAIYGADPTLAASVLYTLVRVGARAEGDVAVRTGRETVRLRITPDPAIP